jgi:K+-transporting ATPase A subunit
MVSLESRLAEVVYEAELHGEVEYDLTSLATEDGARFNGFDGEGTWWLGLLRSGNLFWEPLFLGTIKD